MLSTISLLVLFGYACNEGLLLLNDCHAAQPTPSAPVAAVLGLGLGRSSCPGAAACPFQAQFPFAVLTSNSVASSPARSREDTKSQVFETLTSV